MFFGDVCTSTAGFDFFKDKAKGVCFAFFGFGWRSWWNEAKESSSVVFLQPSCALQEAFKFNTLICKRIMFWLWRRRLLSVLMDHQTGWRLLFFPPLHKSPAVISISLSTLLSCGSGGISEGLLSLPPPKAGTRYLLFIEACSCQAI